MDLHTRDLAMGIADTSWAAEGFSATWAGSHRLAESSNVTILAQAGPEWHSSVSGSLAAGMS